MLDRISTPQAFGSASLEPPLRNSAAIPPLAFDPWKPSVSPKPWTSIVLHHTASSHGSAETIHADHLKRKDRNGDPWLGIAYHFVIGNGNGMPDGEIEPTFRWKQQLHGAHAGDDEHNRRGIGIVLVGNFDLGAPTGAQIASLRRLIASLRLHYGIAGKSVLRHSDIKPTACPGKHFPFAEITQRRMEPALGSTKTATAGLRMTAKERNRI